MSKTTAGTTSTTTTEPVFKTDDRVIVNLAGSPDDGRFGTILRSGKKDTTGQGWIVTLDNEEVEGNEKEFYGKNLSLLTQTDLKTKAEELEAHLAEIREELKAIEDGSRFTALQPGAVIQGGSTIIVKVRPDWWHWFTMAGKHLQHHSNSSDVAVVDEVREWNLEGRDYQVIPHNQD